MSVGHMPGFEEAICKALGIDISKEKVLGIDIAIRPQRLITVTTERILLADQATRLIQVLRGVKWELVEEARP